MFRKLSWFASCIKSNVKINFYDLVSKTKAVFALDIHYEISKILTKGRLAILPPEKLNETP